MLALAKLTPEDRARFEALSLGVATLPPDKLGPALAEPDPSWTERVESEWKRRYGVGNELPSRVMIGRGATLPRIAALGSRRPAHRAAAVRVGRHGGAAFGYLPALGGTELSLAPMRTMLAQPGLFAGVMLSLTAAWLVTAVALGIVFLFVAAWSGTALFRRAVDLVSPLLAVPHAAAAFGLAFLIAPAGFLARAASPQLTGWQRPPDLILVNDPAGLAMMAGLVAKEIPFLLLITLAALPQIEAERTRALTLSLGYGRIAGFCFAAWPRLYPQIRLATFAVLAFSSSVVDVAIILGPTTPPPLSVQLTRWMQDPTSRCGSWPRPAHCCSWR